jgi:hypothetical protein
MVNFQLIHMNYLAILTAWIVHIVLGLIWFHPKLFGNEWSKLTGRELKPSPRWIVPGLLGHLTMILVMLILIKVTNSYGFINGVTIGLLVWVGFIVPMEIGELVWEKIPFKLFIIRIGNHLIGLVASGAILSAWQ